MKLSELTKPISIEVDGPVVVEVTPDGGRIWVNGPEGCALRICRIPKDTLIAWESGFIDVTLGEAQS